MIATKTDSQLNDRVRGWFEGFMHHLRSDYEMLAANVAPPQKQAVYNALANGDANDINMMSRAQSSMYFIQQLVVAYLDELQIRHSRPLKLSMDLSDAKILVWAEIKDDDEAAEDHLRLSEAKVNAQFSQYGFHLTSTIVEQGDQLSTPSHYQSVLS